jgi:Raf kinase inhibitor-like YbhB/YbcL family protein
MFAVLFGAILISHKLGTNKSTNLEVTMNIARWSQLGLIAGSMLLTATASAQDEFQLQSTAFKDGGTAPLFMIKTELSSSGVNACTASGAVGLDQSPELSWTGVPRGTQSFVVVAFDSTANFTHWGMYNIAADIHELPQNAGVANSTYGPEIVNDTVGFSEYDGPCPPPNVTPDVHSYVFTVYALDRMLDLPSSANFPAAAETLYQALIKASEGGHILGHASLTALYSATPGTPHTD